MPQTGRYKVYGTWNSGSSRASNAKYTINAGPNQHTSIQNQRLNGGQWNLLGEYSFDIADNANGQNNVSLSAEANGYLIADAIKLELIEDNQPAPIGLFFIHNDHLGTPKRLTDTQGQVVWSLQTTPFGEVHEEIANGITLLNGFPGQYRDSETGLSYNYYRDYDPSIGRYIESDPIGLGGGMNTYGYVGGNSVVYYDTSGLSQQDIYDVHNEFDLFINQLTKDGGRRSPGFLNNLQRSLHNVTNGYAGEPYLGCWEQADQLLDRLDNLELDDSWSFQRVDRLWPLPHSWVEGESDNPDDPHVTVDPWNDYVIIQHYKGHY